MTIFDGLFCYVDNQDNMKLRDYLLIISIAAVTFTGCSQRATKALPKERGFVTVRNGEFVRDGDTLNFVGTNFWYGPMIASEGRGGNRAFILICKV